MYHDDEYLVRKKATSHILELQMANRRNITSNAAALCCDVLMPLTDNVYYELLGGTVDSYSS